MEEQNTVSTTFMRILKISVHQRADTNLQVGIQGPNHKPLLLQILSNLDESVSFAACMPHALRTLTQGQPVYVILVIIFIDDVSGNVSKQWNKHDCVHSSNSALPREMVAEESNVWFVAMSPSVSAMELMQGIQESLE